MTILGILSMACLVFWGLFLIYGLFVCARGKGDLTWWVWPPLIFAFLPLIFRDKIGEARMDLVIVSLNGLLLVLVLGFFFWERATEKGE